MRQQASQQLICRPALTELNFRGPHTHEALASALEKSPAILAWTVGEPAQPAQPTQTGVGPVLGTDVQYPRTLDLKNAAQLEALSSSLICPKGSAEPINNV